ncbi:hypothetical protein M3936_08875 [Sutcliffiella horikoshii]|uniref:hypothetical protein n=1 Tax=Sutcliffiella horikoshii TaxID=79883 RepID=UPI00203E4455|nr:hypothetical protein [Sutcliffiella horikoshii]MCM3617693.1 hypothetical protein [Sutcliffiella horikoshii]
MNEKNYGHWHLDYFCEETDYYTSATGFWNEEGSWEIYFNEIEDAELYKLFDGQGYTRDKDFGVLLFKANDFDEAHDRFVKWVESVFLPLWEKK